MSLQIRFVPSLGDIVEPVEKYLNEGRDPFNPFAPQTVIVPLIGVRSWLTPELATRLGADPALGDGVVANVHVQYIGHLQKMTRGLAGQEDDPWDIDSVTFAVLQALDGFDHAEKLSRKHHGRLNAARVIASRFEDYAAHRPDLIRSWEQGDMALGDLPHDKFGWQFDLWRRVRGIIGSPPWPVVNAQVCERLRSGEPQPTLPARLMIAGFESVSAPYMEIIDALSTVVDIQLIFVQQSPALAGLWRDLASSIPPDRNALPLASAFDHQSVMEPGLASVFRLPVAWMKGAFDLQLLLSAYGHPVDYGNVSPAAPDESASLLRRLQHGVAHLVADPITDPGVLAADHSVRVHRAHNLARQVEVLHDALLHAFEDLPGLEPHEIIILCADMAAAAPVLEAVFDKSIKVGGKHVRIPLVVADRSLRELSPGAELVSAVLSLVTSRFDLDQFLAVATHPLVTRNFGTGQSDIAVWERHLANTRLRWGLDADHRARHGLDSPGLESHTWLQSLQRALLGAMMQVGEEPVLTAGGVRPLAFVDGSETAALTSLVSIVATLVSLEQQTRSELPVEKWAESVAGCLADLCGDSCTDIDDVLFAMDRFSRAARSLALSTGRAVPNVPFSEFASHLNHSLEATSGRQPLRTGAVTATSFAPLRMVPYRVVCVVGFDDGVLPSGESEGDDLIAAVPMLGDIDARLESRRSFLDALMAAGDRFIVTCTGRNVRNNKLEPLVTPLVEFLDFCAGFGVHVPDNSDKLSSIEHLHPRHLGSPGNFVQVTEDAREKVNAPVAGMIWSHDDSALEVANERLREQQGVNPVVTAQVGSVTVPARLASYSVDDLEMLFRDPLEYYVTKGLGISKEYDNDTDAGSLPLDASRYDLGRQCLKAFDQIVPDGQAAELFRAGDVLPVAPFDEGVLAAALKMVSEFRTEYDSRLPSVPQVLKIQVALPGGGEIVGEIPRYHGPEKTIAYVTFSTDNHKKKLDELSIRAIAAIASGHAVERVDIYMPKEKENVLALRQIVFEPSFDRAAAVDFLESLVDLEPPARSSGFGKFGETARNLYAPKPAKGKKIAKKPDEVFEEFVDNDRTYPGSRELIVFGPDPDFDSLFGPSRTATHDFFVEYFRLVDMRTTKKIGGRDGGVYS